VPKAATDLETIPHKSMPMQPISIFYSKELARFNFGPGHPFTGDRFEGFIDLLKQTGVSDNCTLIPPEPATDADLGLVHTEEYLARVKDLERAGGRLTIDTPVTKDAMEVQTLVTGSGLQAADRLMNNPCDIAHTFGGFHHAGRDYGEGFCLYNDVAIVARALVDRHKLDRILILDTDAHQGNGTMDIFYDEPDVLFISVHQDPRTLYPGRGFTNEVGNGDGKGYTVNVPMPPFSGNGQYERVFEELIKPIAKEFEPQFIIRNGGSDPYHGDDLTSLGLDLDGLNMMGSMVWDIADTSQAKLLDMMVSGYGNMVIYGWLALFCGIERLDVNYKEASPSEPTRYARFSEDALNQATENVINNAVSELREYWSCL